MPGPTYTNPKVPEGISSGHEHPLKEVAKSAAVVVALFAAVVVGCYSVAYFAAPLMPFSWERALSRNMVPAGVQPDSSGSETQKYLTSVAARVAAAIDLPPDMAIDIHYVDDDTINAFATLGGHIVVFKGLWARIDSENAAAMLLGHEIAHIKNRDPVRSAGGTVLTSLVISILGNAFGLADAGHLLTALQFSREQEVRADSDAARAVARLYGHLNGSTDLFARLREAAAGKPEPPKFLATHPHMADRIARLRRVAEREGWTFRGTLKPLPDGVRAKF